jgi:hypothetical protein
MTRYVLLFDNYCLANVGRPLWPRGRVCLLYMLLTLASAVFLRSEYLGLATVIYCLRFETSLFVASYDSQGHGGGIRPRLHKGEHFNWLYPLLITSEHGPYREHSSFVFAPGLLAAEMCLPRRWIATENTVFLLLWALHSNGRCLQSRRLAVDLYTPVSLFYRILYISYPLSSVYLFFASYVFFIFISCLHFSSVLSIFNKFFRFSLPAFICCTWMSLFFLTSCFLFSRCVYVYF